MDAYQPPPPYRRLPSGPPPPADPYHQYYQHPARPPVPPPTQPGGPPAWYSNQFHNPHSPSPPPPPPQQWGPPPPQWGPPPSHQPPFSAGANGNSQFLPPTGPPRPPPYPQASQEWGSQNWGYQQVQGQTSQANSKFEDWGMKAREWAAANEDQQSQSAANPPTRQVYQQYPTHGYQDVHQQAVPGVSYQQHFPVPPTTQPERYPNYATGNESYPGGSSGGLSHQEHLPTSSAIHQQEVPYSYSSVAGKEESGNATQHEVQIPVSDGGGPVHAEQQMQYAYGDQTAAPPSNHSDQPLQFASRESSDYASVPNAWPPHAAAAGVVYPPIPSSVAPIPQHESSMAMPPVSGHTMPPYGRFPPPNLQPVGPPYAYGTKPHIHPVTAFMEDSYAASSAPPKKAPVPNWLKEELLKKKADLGRPSSGSFEEREYIEDDLLYKPPMIADQRDEKSPSKSSDEEEEEDEDEMDAARTTAINMEIKRILTEVLLKVTDELFDEIATKVINEDEAMPKDDSVQHNHKSSSSLPSEADPLHKASAEILVSVEGGNKKASSGSPADVLGLASYASDDDDTDTDVASNANADGTDGVESLGMGSRNDVSQQPSTEKLPEPESMAGAKLAPEVDVDDNSGKNKSALEEYSQMLGSRSKDDETGNTKISDVSATSGLDDGTSVSRTNHPDRTDSGKDAILDEPHRKNSGLKSDCNLRQDSIKSYGKDLSDDASRNRSRTDETKTGKEKVDSQNGSKDRMKQDAIKSAEKVKGIESNKKSNDLHVKKDSRDVEKPHRTSSKGDRGDKREKEKEEERSRHMKDSSKDKRRRSATSNGSSDDSIRKSRSRRRNVSPSPVKSRRKRSSPSSDESSDDSRRKSSSRRRNRSPSPERSKRRHVSSRSPHSKNSQHKHTLYSSHEKSRSKRSRSRSKSPRRRHRAK
ncbi:hypothetical protein V5N11_008834 [Cardamine amara subsp. amara]|uniref:Uncharacterized protein n=1 Tax=Cardamine amara subsp. amara TaxID=228776 RepID=A0ABD1BJ61_CARAN